MRGLRRLRKVRPVAVAYVLVMFFMLGLLVDRRLPAGKEMPAMAPAEAVPALSGAVAGGPAGTAGDDWPTGTGGDNWPPGPGGYQPADARSGNRWAPDDYEWIPPATPPWILLFRPDRQLARWLLEQSIPLLDRGDRSLVLYGEVGRPKNLFAAIFPFLAGSAPASFPETPPPGQQPRQPARQGPPAGPGGWTGHPAQLTPAPGGQPAAQPGGRAPGSGAGGSGWGQNPAPPSRVPDAPPAPGAAAGLPPEAGCRRPPGVTAVGKGIPLVAVYHTHDYEAYISEFPGLQPETDAEWQAIWTTNPERNIIRVGRELARALCERGVTVVHSPTRHAPPMGYFGAYTESRKTARFILQKYPTIRLLLDLHRDGETVADSELAVTIGGRRAATLLIVVGTGHAEAPQPHWQKNLDLARELQAALDARYPGLVRGIKTREGARYNQDLTPGALLFEIGSVRNQMDEALWSVELLAEVLADYLRHSLDPAPGQGGARMGAGAVGTP